MKSVAVCVFVFNVRYVNPACMLPGIGAWQ